MKCCEGCIFCLFESFQNVENVRNTLLHNARNTLTQTEHVNKNATGKRTENVDNEPYNLKVFQDFPPFVAEILQHTQLSSIRV